MDSGDAVGLEELDQRILDIAEANEYLASEANASEVSMPVDMRSLIETYACSALRQRA